MNFKLCYCMYILYIYVAAFVWQRKCYKQNVKMCLSDV